MTDRHQENADRAARGLLVVYDQFIAELGEALDIGATVEVFSSATIERARALRSALHDLVYGGEFAAWMRSANPELPLAAAREYDQACNLMARIVGHPPRDTTEVTMDKPKRTDDCENQISDAREMPSNWQGGTGAGRGPNGAKSTEQCRDAERPAEAHPGAPSKLPGYGR